MHTPFPWFPRVGQARCNTLLRPAGTSKENQPELSLTDLRGKLKEHLKGHWKLKFVCSRGAGRGNPSSSKTKCGCPFALEAVHEPGSEYVLVTEVRALKCAFRPVMNMSCKGIFRDNVIVSWLQHAGHHRHNPNNAESLKKLKLHPFLEAQVLSLYRVGVTPWAIVNHINDMQRNGTLLSHPKTGESGAASYLAQFTNSRYKVGINQVKAILAKWRRDQALDGSDAVTLDTFAKQYDELGCVLHYQPYRPASKDSGTDEQPFVLMLSTPLQQRMLEQFGKRQVFLDATGGTNKYGYMLHVLLVQDDFGRGVPVAFMVSNSEETEVIQRFLEKAAAAVSEFPR